jgi:hypothetical protein
VTMLSNQTDGEEKPGGDERAAHEPSTPTSASGGPDAYVIPRALAQATLDYLAMQPYREVFALVRGFEGLEPVPEGKPGP